MQKVLVAEIGREITVVNAFGNLSTENPLLLGQGTSSTVLDGDIGIGLTLAVSHLEQEIGSVGDLTKIPIYATSSVATRRAAPEVNVPYNLNGKILPTSVAIMQAAQLIYEEVGDVLVIDVGGRSTDVYSITTLGSEPLVLRTVEEDLGVTINALSLVKHIDEGRIKENYGQYWEKLLRARPETPEEIALSAELTAAAVAIALQRHSSDNYGPSGSVSNVEGRNLTQIRWIVGTGLALTQLPNSLEIMRESIKSTTNTLPQGGIPILFDKDNIMASLGVLTTPFRQGAWQLLRESFGVEN